ncbi:hypothetical protein [Planomicrobium sp. YIM 101495]|nr:hypothetical protein [Planomicrobium sp. YIM 101495]
MTKHDKNQAKRDINRAKGDIDLTKRDIGRDKIKNRNATSTPPELSDAF